MTFSKYLFNLWGWHFPTVPRKLIGGAFALLVASTNASATDATASDAATTSTSGVPVCTLNATPVVTTSGSAVTLRANCSPAATSYTWGNSGFSSTESEGIVSPDSTTQYTVVGNNAAGSSEPASAEVYVCNTAPFENYKPLVSGGATKNDQPPSTENIQAGNDAGFDTLIHDCNRSKFAVRNTTSGWKVSSITEALGMSEDSRNGRAAATQRAAAIMDLSGNNGKAFRIYQAAFNRAPDDGGLTYWINRLNTGTSLYDVAVGFFYSNEFKDIYGANPSNADFLTKLYNNVLDRSPDPGGHAWWLDQLNTGKHSMITALMGFSESPENTAGVAERVRLGCYPPNKVKNGVCVTPEISCTLPKVKQNGVCVTPINCTLPQIEQNGVCVTPKLKCTLPEIEQNGICCALPQIEKNGVCVTPVAAICAEANRLANMNLLPKQIAKIGHYTDIFSLPQTKTECTNTYDTGVPDPTKCTTSYDPCASKWYGPFGTWGCIPGTTTKCKNIFACNTWANYKKTMECDIVFDYQQIKYIDKAIATIKSVQSDLAGAVPAQCVNPSVTGVSNTATQISQALIEEVKQKIINKVKEAATEAASRWAVKTIVTIIPSGGTSVFATTTAEIIAFTDSIYKKVKPILEYVNDAKEVLGNAGLRTDCSWSDWNRI